jgi:hypothetical protein
MDSYDQFAGDQQTGAWLAHTPIDLKAYLTRSGQLDLFNRALQVHDPKLRASFARVRTLQEHTAADFPWLRELNEALDKNMVAIERTFLQVLPEDEAQAIDRIAGNSYYRLYEDAGNAVTFPSIGRDRVGDNLDNPAFRGMVIGDRNKPHYIDFVRASINSEYPPSAENTKLMWRMGPFEFIDYEHLSLCPGVNPSRRVIR